MAGSMGAWAWFLAAVALPTAAAAAYFSVLAADRFESVSLFVLRILGINANTTVGSAPAPTRACGALAPGKTAADSALASSALPRIGQDDSFSVRDFVLSRAGMAAAGRRVDLRAALSAPWADFWWTHPGYFWRDTEEALYRQYQRMVSVKYDFNTGGTEMRVQAMSPEAARALSEALLDAAEELINRLNERSERDAVRTAEEDVAHAKADVDAALERLAAFRERERIIDPTGAAKVTTEVLIKLTTYLVEAKAEAELLRKAAQRSPQLPVIEARAAAIQAEIDREKATLSGSDGGLAGAIAEYERLALDKEFGTKRAMLAMAALETARRDAGRKKAYLERVAPPALPDEAAGPWRVLGTLVVAFVGLCVFGTAASVRKGVGGR